MDFAIIPETVKERFNYCANTGVITWAVNRPRVRIGDPAGTFNHDGYIAIRTGGKSYLAHRLAWFLHYGVNPPSEIDHINRKRADNRICNLRVTDHVSNMLNQGWKPYWRARKGRNTYVVAEYRGKSLYLGKSILTAWFRRIMAEKADAPLRLH